MPHDLQASLAAYRPYNEQEQRDLPLLLAALKQPDSFTRQNETAHFTASAWVVNKPTSDGWVTSLELYASTGDLIAQFFGERKEGRKELAQWRALLDELCTEPLAV